MARLDFFDFNIILGRPNIPKLRFREDAAVMRAELAELGITGGLVRHTLGEESHPAAGNARLDQAVSAFHPFRPAWTVLPHWTGEFPSPQKLVTDMKAARATAAVMYPVTHGFQLRRSVVGPLLDALEEAGVALALPQAQVPYPAAEEIARSHPSLALVLLEVSYRSARELYPLMEHCPDLHIETSTYMVHRGIEEICRLFGASRLLFGSRYPFYNPGAAVAGVTYAEISEDDKRMVARGNAEILLGRAFSGT